MFIEIMEDSYGNFIIQKLLYQVDSMQKANLLEEIKSIIPNLQKKNVQKKWSSIVEEHFFTQPIINEREDRGCDIKINYGTQSYVSNNKLKKSNLKKENKPKSQKIAFNDTMTSNSPHDQSSMYSNTSMSSQGQAYSYNLQNPNFYPQYNYNPQALNYNHNIQPAYPHSPYTNQFQFPNQNYGYMSTTYNYDNSLNNIYYQKDKTNQYYKQNQFKDSPPSQGQYNKYFPSN